MSDINDRLAAVRELCPTASADDLLELVENHATAVEAAKHWTATLCARLEVRDEELATRRTQNRRELAELKARLDAEQREKDAELANMKHQVRIVKAELGE